MGVFITTTRWPTDVYERVKRAADSLGISVNSLIVEAGKCYLDSLDAPKDVTQAAHLTGEEAST